MTRSRRLVLVMVVGLSGLCTAPVALATGAVAARSPEEEAQWRADQVADWVKRANAIVEVRNPRSKISCDVVDAVSTDPMLRARGRIPHFRLTTDTSAEFVRVLRGASRPGWKKSNAVVRYRSQVVTGGIVSQPSSPRQVRDECAQYVRDAAEGDRHEEHGVWIVFLQDAMPMHLLGTISQRERHLLDAHLTADPAR